MTYFSISKFCVSEGELEEPRRRLESKGRERKRRVNTIKKWYKFCKPIGIFARMSFITSGLNKKAKRFYYLFVPIALSLGMYYGIQPNVLQF